MVQICNMVLWDTNLKYPLQLPHLRHIDNVWSGNSSAAEYVLRVAQDPSFGG